MGMWINSGIPSESCVKLLTLRSSILAEDLNMQNNVFVALPTRVLFIFAQLKVVCAHCQNKDELSCGIYWWYYN
ncbi:hypothetical protein EMCRGX_G004716 [Ephydatia muelleri]